MRWAITELFYRLALIAAVIVDATALVFLLTFEWIVGCRWFRWGRYVVGPKTPTRWVWTVVDRVVHKIK